MRSFMCPDVMVLLLLRNSTVSSLLGIHEMCKHVSVIHGSHLEVSITITGSVWNDNDEQHEGHSERKARTKVIDINRRYKLYLHICGNVKIVWNEPVVYTTGLNYT